MTDHTLGEPSIKNPDLLDWVAKMAQLTKANAIRWCDGSAEERQSLTELATTTGTLIPLNSTKTSWLLFAPLKSERCCTDGESYLCLFGFKSRRRSYQQLDAARRSLPETPWLV